MAEVREIGMKGEVRRLRYDGKVDGRRKRKERKKERKNEKKKIFFLPHNKNRSPPLQKGETGRDRGVRADDGGTGKHGLRFAFYFIHEDVATDDLEDKVVVRVD